MSAQPTYPPEAYASEGVLWWKLTHWPGSRRRFGAERRAAAWLAFNLEEGDTFTMAQLRHGLGNETAEHLNRRLRKLRNNGWLVPSNKDDKSLRPNEYRLERKGWHPALGERPASAAGNVSAPRRRQIFERDGHRCTVCGVGAGECYPGRPDHRAVLTVGHRIPQAHGGTDHPDNLRTECADCNQTVRNETAHPETYVEVLAQVRRLNARDRELLVSWMVRGERTRSDLDTVYDRTRQLSPDGRGRLMTYLRGGQP